MWKSVGTNLEFQTTGTLSYGDKHGVPWTSLELEFVARSGVAGLAPEAFGDSLLFTAMETILVPGSAGINWSLGTKRMF
jgi:hypothetical protein